MDHEKNKNHIPVSSHINEFLIRALHSEAQTLQEFPELNISSDLTLPISTQLITEVAKSAQQNELYPSTKPSTSKVSPAEFKPIQIIIGDNNDADVPSTSSSLVSSQPESLQDAKVYNRIRELREAGLWDSTKLPKCEDPPRRKTHWDFVLEEVLWMAMDFKNERKTKRHWARKIASNAKAVWRKTREENKKQSTSTFGRDEKESKRVCSSIAKMIREFWQNVDKVVDFRANEIVESKKRKALDQHLNFLVGAADKITSIIQESLAESPLMRQSAHTSVADEQSDSEAEADEEEGTDDETTIEKEEEAAQNHQQEEELDDLYKERDMDIDQLLTTLPRGYLNSLVPLKNAEDLDEEGSSSRMESVEDDEQTKEMEAAANAAILNDKPDLQNVDCEKLTSENSEVRRKELDNIAEAALEFQPRGYTLETTEVKTEVPFLLCGQLREYQLVGLDWLVTLYDKNLNGILADEMGLGKTIQTIALLAHLACARAVWGPHLIIVPTSVILNWEMELKKWCPSLKILTYFGTAKERAEKRKGWSKMNAFHVCITSYKLATQDIRAFKKKAWQYLILDEAQNIKNFRSQRWQMLLGLRSRRRLLLTGTPLQNSLMELWALLHFLMPNVFASHDDFKDWFHNPITGMVEGTNELDQALVQRLHKVLRPFILRRLKSEVEKQLPTKTEKIIPCSLSKRQRFLYNEFLSKTATVENLRSGNMLSVLGVIMQLRKCCNHPNLFEPRPVISPYVAPMISPQFPRLIFSIQSQQSKDNRRVNLLIQNVVHTSMNAWTVFNEISTPTSILNEPSHPQSGEESQHFPDGLKFVMDAHGGHFYRPKRPPSESKESSATPMSNGVTHNIQSAASFVNSTSRKRRWLSGDGQNGESSQQQSSSTSSNVPAIFQSALAELKTMEKRRDSANREIGIKLTKILRTFGSPKLSNETVRICQEIFLDEDSKTSFGQIGGNLFEKVNERIAQQMLNWIEPSLNRFLICIKKLLLDRHFEPALISATEKHKNHLLKLCSTKIYSTQSNLAHQVEIASKLEFPELRLIEYDCGKLQVLAKLLGQLHENKHRCLIFTQMSRMLDILQAFLSYHNYKYFRLDGATHIDQRQAMMERFNSDDSIFCFILSTRSGGIGVNLTGADTVIFYDSDWNPTMDAQAQDRCHRIGQTRNVTIYRLISERTIEENILTKSMQKRKLGEMAIDEGEFTPEFFKSATNLRELFSNEETIAEVIAPVVNPAQNSKEIETAMQSVEDQQDVVAAQMARQETMADSAEFDENLVTANDIDLENPSEQYLELIKALKPIERYAVNFLAKEYRPALDREFEETEALIKAKQKELMQDEEMFDDEQESVGQSEDSSTLDGGLTYESGAANELSFLATLNVPFDEIPTWMPPSPPNSVEGAPYYCAIDGAYLYESTRIPEEKLPPLPSLISLNEVPPRIRQRKLLGSGSGIKSPSTRLSPSQKRQKVKKTTATNWPTSGGKLANRPMDPPSKFRHPKEEKMDAVATPKVSSSSSSVTSNSALLSPPNTPAMASSIPSAAVLSMEQSNQVGKFEDVQLNGEQLQQQQRAGGGGSSMPPSRHSATPSINSLDEAIESTVRKSRKQIGHPPPISRYLTRYLGPHPSVGGSERLATDQNRVVYRVILATNTLTLPTTASTEPIDYEGPAWNAIEDFFLLKAITERHGLAAQNHLLLQNAGIQINWEFVSQYLCRYTTNYRSPRQCALRYQNHVLRCDDAPSTEKGSASSRRHRTHSMVAPPQSVIFDTNFCVQEAVNSVRKHSSIVAEIGKPRGDHHQQHQPRPAQSGQQSGGGGGGGGHHHSHSSHHPTPPQQQTPQLLCMSGRIPHSHEQRLAELGAARHSNVARPMDILMKSRQMMRAKSGVEPKATAAAADGTITIKKGNGPSNLAMGRR